MKNIISLKVTAKQKIDTFYEGVDRLLERIYQLDTIKVIRSHIDQFVNTFNQISNKMIYLLLTTYSVIFTFVSFNLINFQSRSYDYVFHLTRIVGLAESIEHWDLLPNLNFLFAFGAGYASPMFYGNWQFYPSAIVYMMTNDGNFSYSIFSFLITLCTCLSSYIVVSKIVKNKVTGIVAALTIPCYYTLFGFGMTMVIPLVPILIYSIYRVLYLNKKNPLYLGIVVALLIQTHILSTIILAIFSGVFLLLNYKKLTLEKIISFVFSILFALCLSAGYIFQYLEQVSSQKFFFTWVARSFPVNVKDTFFAPFPFQADRYGFYKPFTPLEWPIHQFVRDGLFYASMVVILFYRRLGSLSKTVFWTCWILYLSATSLLPWHSILKYTFLGSMQYSGRLLFFIPLLFLFFLAFTNRNGFLSIVFCILSLTFYFNQVVPQFDSSSKYYKQMREDNIKNEKLLKSVYKGDKSKYIDPVGDEYYNLDINNQDVRLPQFTEFKTEKGVKISNIKKKYNILEFDIMLSDDKNESTISIPLIWYKGYRAEYSKGTEGSQPMLSQRSFTESELKQNKKSRKPAVPEKTLNNGKIHLSIRNSGHVKVSYHKTFLQYLGFFIEWISWIFVFLIFKKKYSKNREQFSS